MILVVSEYGKEILTDDHGGAVIAEHGNIHLQGKCYRDIGSFIMRDKRWRNGENAAFSLSFLLTCSYHI